MGANPEIMENLLAKQGLSSVEILISKGHLEILKYYLPEYILNLTNQIEESEPLAKPLAHIAVAKGFIHIVDFIHSYFLDVDPPPAFDLNYVNPVTRENSALIAAKNCNFPMTRFLNETCKVDFSLINAENKSALQLAVLGSKEGLVNKELFLYLIDKCNVDVKHEYKDVLKHIDDPRILEYIQNLLEESGVFYKKESLEADEIKSPIMYQITASDESNITIREISSIAPLDLTYQLSFSIVKDLE